MKIEVSGQSVTDLGEPAWSSRRANKFENRNESWAFTRMLSDEIID